MASKADSIDLSVSSDNRTYTLVCSHCDNIAKLQANNALDKKKLQDIEVVKKFAAVFKKNHELCYLKPARNLKTEITNYIN